MPRNSRKILAAFVATAIAFSSTREVAAAPSSGPEYIRDAQSLFQSGYYFRAARYAFAALDVDAGQGPEAYSWITLSLIHAGFYQSASYFFIRTLQTGNRAAIRRVLADAEPLMVRVGGDLLRKYMIRHTSYDDYPARGLNAFLYAMGKDSLLKGEAEKAVNFLNGISNRSPLWPYALQLRGTAYAIAGKDAVALRDFEACAANAGNVRNFTGEDRGVFRLRAREEHDLEARCFADQARTLYQMNRFEDAEGLYDRIPKSSLVWPDILFEQAWNAFARNEFNRTLGKLVSYKSPALSFVFNPEADTLRAQSYLALCLYSDANNTINEFNGKYAAVGREVKQFVEGHAKDLGAFHDLGKQVLGASIYSKSDLYRMVNRFIRGPYFQGLVSAERDIREEQASLRRAEAEAGQEPGARAFPAFLDQVLKWRVKSIRLLGGNFVKNSLIDHHTALIADFEKMSFIKLEMLKRAKDQLVYKGRASGDRSRGNVRPERRDYQYFWSFNGEFWNDELGDYVFGLESECQGTNVAH